tara:strand:+ start:3467 stop:4564 length:1098 start_codon:yes stop_codon:yes gene_type:complete
MKALSYGLSFLSSCIATAILSTPMPYVIQNKAELGQVLEQYAINKQSLELNSRSYNNPALMGLTGLAALVSFGFMIKELSDKPLIEMPIQQSQPQTVIPPIVNNINVRNTAVNHGDRTQAKQRYTPDLVGNTNNKNPYAWMDTLHKVNCLLIYGQQGAGKTTYVDMEVKARQALGHQILVFDPHREYGAWEGLEVVGDGMDYEAIDTELANVNSLIKSRYEQRATVEGFNPRPMTIICEEFTDWAVKCQSSDEFFLSSLKDCRKVKIHVIYVAHARTMGVLTKKAGMSVMFENGSTKIEVLGKPDADGGTIPTGFADLYNDPRDSKKAVRVAIPDLSNRTSDPIDDLFVDEIPIDNVIPLRRQAS